MRVFAVSGYSRTGKTTLVETLVQELTKRGYSVATVKSTKDEPQDAVGSDTWRHREAGALATALLSARAAVIRRFSPLSLEEAVRNWEFDFVLIEGMKDADLPKFWCVRDMPEETAISKNMKAIVTLERSSSDWPDIGTRVLTLKDTGLLADIVEQEATNI